MVDLNPPGVKAFILNCKYVRFTAFEHPASQKQFDLVGFALI
jgi:hypothetical protein